MLQTHIQILSQHLNHFEQAKPKILHGWVNQELIGSILEYHDVDLNHFINYYASGVFDYFLSVIKGETLLGSCPVMEEFLAYLKNRNFHADELFILCSHFKKAMLDSSYDMHINTKELFAAISFLFDANFSGVLRLYTDTIYQKEQVIAKSLTLLNEYKNAIDSSSLVTKTDLNGRITYANENFCKLSGYTLEALIGKNHNIVQHPDTPKSFYEQLWQAIQSNHIFKGTIKNAKKDGTPYYVDLTIVPLSDPMQGILEYISIGYEVTSLVQAKEEAFEASLAKEHFLSTMSHEIRTPLNAILGFISILQEQTHTELASHYLDIVAHSGKHLLNLINDVLDFSKLKNDAITPKQTLFETKKSFGHLIELFTQSAKDKQLSLLASLDPSLPAYIETDAMRIQQILSNLLSNAIKFTPQQGYVKLFITSEHHNLIIKVQDNGIGISADYQEAIFKPFTQAHKGHEGTGLGLAITRELITAMKGSISLESRENQGTCFTVTLPFKPADNQQIDQLISQPKEQTKHFNAHILVAEDNEDNQELIALLLRRFGLSFELVGDGRQALEAFEKRDFDMVILDDEMPGLKGFQTAFKLRENEAKQGKPATPIMILSANVTHDVKNRAVDAGANYFVGKPIEPQKLQEIFARHFKVNPGINTKALALSLALEEEELSLLLELFKTNLPKNIKLLQEAIQDKHHKSVSKAAHKIKGSASNFYFETVMQLCETLEQKAYAKEGSAYDDLYKDLLQELNALGFDPIPLP